MTLAHVGFVKRVARFDVIVLSRNRNTARSRSEPGAAPRGLATELAMKSRRGTLAALGALLLAPTAAKASASIDNRGIEVSVTAIGEGFEILVALAVPVPQPDAWRVLVDFDEMAAIVSNLHSSRVVSRTGNVLIVEQSGVEAEGPLRIPFHSVREVELHPTSSMHARLLRGSMRRLEGWTRLTAAADGTFITSRGEMQASGWVPPLVAPHFIRRATLRQYAELRNEMLRRSRKA